MKVNPTLLKYIGILFLVMVLSAGAVRVFGGGETLYDYAEKNPDIAYQTKTDTSLGKDALAPPVREEIPSTDSDKPSEESLTQEVSVEAASTPSTPVEDTSPETYSQLANVEEIAEKPNQKDEEIFMENRITYQEGFYYEPIPDSIKEKINGVSYKENPHITYDDLRYLKVLYHDFNEETQVGELICNQAIAQDLVEIFYELYQNEYQIDKIRLIDEYGGDDTLSMEDDNTSCFNYRVVDGTTKLSKHALGLAIDINPFYNPYIVFNRPTTGETYISPKGSEIYTDRDQEFPYKIDYNDLCYRLFKEHGFTWGGDWNSTKDYQHFQKVVE